MGFLHRHGNRGDGQVGVIGQVLLQHLVHIHLVDVIAAEDADELRLLIEDQLEVLEDRVRCSAEPERPFAHLRRHDVDVLADLGHQPPGAGDVLDERVRLELRHHLDLEEAGVDEIVDDEVDDAIAASERHGRLGAVARQRVEPLAHAAGEDHRQNVAACQ